VEDTGIGIKENNIPKLFKMFSLVSNSRKMNKSGTGLGLFICKQLSKELSPKEDDGI